MNTFCEDRKSTRLNSSHMSISYAVVCLKKKKIDLRRADVVKEHTAGRQQRDGAALLVFLVLVPPPDRLREAARARQATPSFFFHCSGDARDLHSFPTRRFSD